MGRTKDTIWTKFTILSASGATDKVKCSKCEVAAYLLDHRYEGRKLDPEKNAENWSSLTEK